MLRSLLVGAFVVLSLACARAEQPHFPSRLATTPSGGETERAARPPAEVRLVVAVVIDQLPSSALERYRPLLDANGALRQALEHGASFDAEYGYAGTYTAPGHATLFTGVLPRTHGVVANEIWDPARARVVSVVDDGEHPVLGTKDQFASPLVLRAPTVADALEASTGGRALTVSLSLKDRAAVLPAGHHPDLVLFYDAKRGSFTTSSFYAGGTPSWLTAFEASHPISARLGPWEPTNSAALSSLLGPDARSGEGGFQGLDNAFPHEPSRAPDPLTAFRITPASTDYLFELARAAVDALELGQDEVPDLLMLSVSAVDYAGHAFGGDSWEYADSLVRTDRALTRFLASLGERGPVRLLVTSDHGAAPLPERALERGHLAFRVPTKRLAQNANVALSGRFGLHAPPIASYTEPFIYLTPEAKSSASYAAIVDAVANEAGRTPGVAAVYPLRDFLAKTPTDVLAQLVRGSVTEDATADLFVVPGEYSVVDPSVPGGSGTSHGSPWTYDRRVPVLFFGPGVAPVRQSDAVSVLRVAPTLAALLGVPAPRTAEQAPLPGAPKAPPAPRAP